MLNIDALLGFNLAIISPHQTFVTFQHNISQHCWAQFGHPAVIVMCYDVLGVASPSLNMANWNFSCHIFVNVAWSCTRLVRFVQECCVRECALVQNRVAKGLQHVPPNNVVISCLEILRSFSGDSQMLEQQYYDFLFWNVAIIWSGGLYWSTSNLPKSLTSITWFLELSGQFIFV